ncbi:hypothetical protein BC941DRAFT_419988 [Chlamydoabsidia padenii]|nr:hypothetical protein BC941DRAFT_419988 [Chlamydoabsidia padenii]
MMIWLISRGKCILVDLLVPSFLVNYVSTVMIDTYLKGKTVFSSNFFTLLIRRTVNREHHLHRLSSRRFNKTSQSPLLDSYF